MLSSQYENIFDDRLLKDGEKFWTDNPKILFDNYTSFFPQYNSSRIEQLNSLTRFIIYFTLLVLMFDKSYKWLYLSIGAIILIVIFYNIIRFDNNHGKKEFDKIMNIRKEKKIKNNILLEEELSHDDQKKFDIDIDSKYYDDKTNNSYDLQVGYYDSNNNLNISSYYSPFTEIDDKSLFSVDEQIKFEKATCKKPTKDNPFMNPLLEDLNKPDVAPCNANDEDIHNESMKYYNMDLFRDINELYDKKNSQRQFYTINNGIPDQKSFAEWLYKVPVTCKQDQIGCLKYDPLITRNKFY